MVEAGRTGGGAGGGGSGSHLGSRYVFSHVKEVVVTAHVLGGREGSRSALKAGQRNTVQICQ